MCVREGFGGAVYAEVRSRKGRVGLMENSLMESSALGQWRHFMPLPRSMCRLGVGHGGSSALDD